MQVNVMLFVSVIKIHIKPKSSLNSPKIDYVGHIPGLILNFGILGCLLEINLMGWSVDCLCRSVAEISWIRDIKVRND